MLDKGQRLLSHSLGDFMEYIVQKFGVGKIFEWSLFHGDIYTSIYSILRTVRILNVFDINLIRSPRLHLFDEKYSKNSNIVKYYYNLKWPFSIFKCLIKLKKLKV